MQSTDTARRSTEQAIAALRDGRAQQARDHASAAIRAGADNAAAWGVLAMACRDQGDLEAAQQAADRSIAHEPRNPRVYVVKGDAFFASGNRRAAAAYYRDALKFGRPDAGSPDMLADLQRAESRAQELHRDFERYVLEQVGDVVDKAAGDTRRMQNAIDILCGKRQIFFPQPQHIFFPGLPVVDFCDPSQFDWVPEVEAATGVIRGELDALLQNGVEFSPYLQAAEDRPAYDTHGLKDNSDWGACYLWYNGEAVEENQARCPMTTEIMQRVPLVYSGARCPNVLFSRLKAGSTIPAHTGMINTRLICHLPLIVPGDCGFRVANESRRWEPGKVWLFDDTMEHEAWNHSSEDRIILIFEVWKPELRSDERALITRLLEAVDNY